MNLWLKKLVSNLPAQRKRRSFSVRRLELQLFSQGRAEPLKVPTARLDLYRRPCCRHRSSLFREARKNPPLHGDLQVQGPCSPHLLWVPEGGRRFAGTRVYRTCARCAAFALRTGHNEGIIFLFTVVLGLACFLGTKRGPAGDAPVKLERSPENKKNKDVSYKRYRKHKVKNRKELSYNLPS